MHGGAAFFTGILLSWLFSTVLRWFVHGNFPDLRADFPGALKYLFFAAVSLAIPRAAMTVRMLRSTILAGDAEGLCPHRHLPGQ